MSTQLDHTYEEAHRAIFGCSEAVARIAAAGRDPVRSAVDTFRELGLSEAAAKVAARGRDGRSLDERFEDPPERWGPGRGPLTFSERDKAAVAADVVREVKRAHERRHRKLIDELYRG